MRLLIALACLLAACGRVDSSPPVSPARPSGDLGAYFDHAPDFPGYPWTFNGTKIDNSHGMNTIAGPAHCGWQTAAIMFLPWPIGTVPKSGADLRQYVRDPKGVMPAHVRSVLDRHATLPADARPTGYQYQSLEVYLSPSDQDDAAYIVGPAAVERWPRSDPMTLCS